MSDSPTEAARVWDLIESVGVGMLTTRHAGGLRARPLEPRPDRARGLIWFVTDARGGKDDEIAAAPETCLTIVDATVNAYLSISGHSEVRHDPAMAAAIWRNTDDVWWPQGPEDTHVRVIRFAPDVAELWDGPSSRLVLAFEFAKARLTGAEPNVGENRKSTIGMP